MQNRLGGRMSGGEQQMLTVARTLMGNPYLVLLDEPSEGVAPVIDQTADGAGHPCAEAAKAQASAAIGAERSASRRWSRTEKYVLEKGEIAHADAMRHPAPLDVRIRSGSFFLAH